ncbi:MAG: hypothetical protein A3C07_04420 [Candidatus Sungbacteria bacterium RIFCSPHIGHO2_02_FULL_47_11]|uniref:Uncharacterized protein n=1 Tax=Candidatus Sungbacteria bacterium RIFCSPHIGHO2_02_FULL_47_11 TaxID=1802270 RepID=A0A1G2KG63_9BACT|nr:MAG: hypothetical protein A3C07_04420 [Candidatus Sungbacteria bacterium RIFCSPHIGHO2_02_FULL_47_11]
MAWILWALVQWWFYPAALVYIAIGAWFGSINFLVAKRTEEYRYVVKFLLYPISTVFREGWSLLIVIYVLVSFVVVFVIERVVVCIVKSYGYVLTLWHVFRRKYTA